MTRPSGDPSSNADADGVLVGRILGAWGLRGDVSVEPLTDNPDRFQPGGVVYVDDRRAVILRSRPHKRRRVVAFDLASDRNAAEALRGKALTVPASALPPLERGDYFHFDIIDMVVRSEDGDTLGRIADILSSGAGDVYVTRGDEWEILIPAVKQYIADVDLDAGVITVSLPDAYVEEMRSRVRAL